MARIVGRRTGNPLDPGKRQSRRSQTIIVAALAFLLVALTAVGGAILLARKPVPGASARTDAKTPAAAAGRRESKREVVIPGLDEYLGEPGPDRGGVRGEDSNRPSRARALGHGEWVDASKSSAERGDVEVRITSAEIGRPRLIGRSTGIAARPQKDYLILRLELLNRNKTKKLEYNSWNARGAGVSLVDNLRNSYRMRSFLPLGAEINGQVEGGRGSLYPEQVTEDVLVFEKPVDAAAWLRLELPAAAFAEPGTLKFEIPGAMVTTASEPEDASGPGEAPAVVDGPAGSDGQVSPGREVPAIRRGIEQLEAERAASKRDARSPAGGLPSDEQEDRGPIAVPGLTDAEGAEEGDSFSFADDPKLRRANEELRQQQERKDRASEARRHKRR